MVRRVHVTEEDWDHLIVLDGCRYDYFLKVHASFLEGKLEKVVSVGSNTVEWRDNSFPGNYDDVVYVSANPHINSTVEVGGFRGGEHFHEVVDVWCWGWDRELGTVHPSVVNEAALRARREHPGRRLIVHYLQPHCPYIGYQPGRSGFPSQEPASRTVLDGVGSDAHRQRLREKVYELISAASSNPAMRRAGFLRKGLLWRLREVLGLPPESPMDAARRALGVAGLRHAYAGNLELVLEHVSELLNVLPGTVVVTSDHGDLLGEGGRFSHGYGRKDPLLLQVPWFTVER